MAALTFERASELLALDADGAIRWKVGRRGGVSAGQVAGHRYRDGYRRLSIDGKTYPEHHIVWLMTHGRLPNNLLDHINGVKDDNRPCNLREATHSQNTCNRRGVTGVTLHKGGKFQAQIKLQGRSYYLGLYANREDAEAAYREASARLHGEFGAAA